MEKLNEKTNKKIQIGIFLGIALAFLFTSGVIFGRSLHTETSSNFRLLGVFMCVFAVIVAIIPLIFFQKKKD